VTAREPEDGLLDLLAAVAAARDGLPADLKLILSHGSHTDMLLAAIRLLREVADELAHQGATPEDFRRWGMQAGSRYRS
jgi:hypothetical protein